MLSATENNIIKTYFLVNVFHLGPICVATPPNHITDNQELNVLKTIKLPWAFHRQGSKKFSIHINSCLFLSDGLSNGVDSVVELLYLLCSTQDSHTEERVTAILSWLMVVTASQAHIASCKYVQCVGAILWANPSLSHLVTNDLFRYVINHSSLGSTVPLKSKIPGYKNSSTYMIPYCLSLVLQHNGLYIFDMCIEH